VRSEDIDLVAALCRTRAGLKVDREKTYLIESRLGALARREGFGAVEDMLDALRARREERMIWSIVAALALSAPA